MQRLILAALLCTLCLNVSAVTLEYNLANASNTEPVLIVSPHSDAVTPPAESLKAGRVELLPTDLNGVQMFHSGLDTRKLYHHETFLVELPDQRVVEIIAAEKYFLADDILYVAGPIAPYTDEDDFYATLAISSSGVIADFELPDGHYSLHTEQGVTRIIDPETRQYSPQMMNDWDDQPIRHSPRHMIIDPSQFSTKKYGKGITTLNLALVLSQTHGTSANAVMSATYRLALANTELTRSNVNVRLQASLITRVKPQFDVNLNTNIINTISSFNASGFNWLDLQFAGMETEPANATQLTIHQYVLFVGAGNDTNCGVSAAPVGGIARHSIVRAAACSDNFTLAHEVAHNLSCGHSDGVFKSFLLGGEFPRIWKSVMQPGHSPNGNPREIKRYFTSGDGNTTDISCGGVCNVQPYSAHNCAGKMNATAPMMAGMNDVIVIPGTSTPPDSWEVDDSASQASNYLAMPQNHNFHDNGDIDWVRYYSTPAQVTIRTTNLGPNADTCIDLYRSNNTATGTAGGVIASDCDDGPGQSSLIQFTQNDEWVYYVRIRQQNGSVSGAGTEYTLQNQRYAFGTAR